MISLHARAVCGNNIKFISKAASAHIKKPLSDLFPCHNKYQSFSSFCIITLSHHAQILYKEALRIAICRGKIHQGN
jgi:hypothetical protein